MATKLCAALIQKRNEVSTMNPKYCVAYLRYSTDNQTENSIEYQRAAIEKYCAQNKLALLHEYIDQALSATNDRRPGFQRMMEDAKSNPEWETILVYDLSRIFRNVNDATLYKAVLSDSGIRIVSVTEPLADSDEGWLTGTITDTLNEYYSRQTKRKTHAGMTTKANKGEHCGGIPPLGYDVGTDGKLIINEAEAETVREIFQLYNLGYSLKSMAKILNDKGLRTKAGVPFTKNSFHNILTQEKYTGIYCWNKRRAKDSKGRHNNHAYKPAKEQVVIEGGCPAILPLEEFQSAQEKLSQRRQGRADTKSRHHYMLGGLKLLKCAECDATMAGKVTTSHGKKYTMYACPKHKGGQCPTKDIRADEVESYVSNTIVESLVTKSNIPRLNRLVKSSSATTRQLQSELRNVEKKIYNIADSLENRSSRELSERLEKYEREKDRLTAQLSEANTDAPYITDENLAQVKKQLSEIIRDSDAPEVREMLKTYIQEIRVSNDNVNMTLQI